jgi:DNA damage-inducible protein 1
MRLTITTLNDEIFSFEVSDDMDLENFRALCEIETNIVAREIVVFWNGRPLHDDKRKHYTL